GGRTSVERWLVIVPSFSRSTEAISMTASLAGSTPVVSMSMTLTTIASPTRMFDTWASRCRTFAGAQRVPLHRDDRPTPRLLERPAEHDGLAVLVLVALDAGPGKEVGERGHDLRVWQGPSCLRCGPRSISKADAGELRGAIPGPQPGHPEPSRVVLRGGQ